MDLKPIVNKEINVKVFGGNSSVKNIETFCVKDISGNESVYVSAFVSDICQPLTGQAIEMAVKNHPYLQNLHLADSNPECRSLDIDLVIGVDQYWSFFGNTLIRNEHGGPIAMGSKLGFVLSSPVLSPENCTSSTNLLVSTHSMKIQSEFINENVKLSEMVDKFWNLESLGISPTEASIYETFTADIKFQDQRYQVKLPFKEHHDDLKDHYNIAKARLKGQFHKFKNNKKLLLECDTIFKEQGSLSIIEKITGDDDCPGHTRNYLPHRPVVREDKITTKVRIVFDASAKQNGVSLNVSHTFLNSFTIQKSEYCFHQLT